jgi:ATP-dependent DNA helicase RecG
MMVPTEVLAEQHARTLRQPAARLGIAMAVLTAATPKRERAALMRACAEGRLGLLIGTQALLDPALRPADLRLVVVDEQHRFGVAQRARLRRTGGAKGAPHLLVLSATPIPRTLALALHGDLDASVLGERPGGRPTPVTKVCADPASTRLAYEAVREAVGRGRQGFVVCPIRERSRRAGAVTALARYATLRRELAPARVGLLHGALAAEEKEAVLRAFAEGRLDVLVATTVVELGIDVPNATAMIVEEADRFGLAQLHQLRGRVGRGEESGVCFLCATTRGGGDEGEDEGEDVDGDGLGRLKEIAVTGDGFKVAEKDLARRGLGDPFGTRQAGVAAIGGGDVKDLFELVEVARREAEGLLADDPGLERAEHRALGRAARARADALAVHAGEAG